ncbi:hypothetical protein L7F22_066056 [Adiantum nelumboides]|nr:hypothetical protein [Adiantum nelumboides]
MSDHSGSGSRSPSLSDAEVSRFLERLTPEQLASVASRAQQSLSEQSSPTQSARSASSASSSRRSRLSRASGPERGSERGSHGCGCCGDRDDVDTSASQRVPSERGGPSGRQTLSERDTASEGGTPLGRQTPSSSRVQETVEHTPSGTQESTPEGTPLAHRRQLPDGYSYLVDASGAIIMTPEGKELVSVIDSHGSSSWNAIFLAVDNIVSEESIRAVSRILPNIVIGHGHGSKVILTARTREVLHRIMIILPQNCTYDYLAMPSINEAEAMGILLQTTGQGTDARALGCAEAQLDNYMVAQKQKVLQVVRMCGFGPKDGPLMYSPVVMQRMGVALIIRQNNVNKWAHDQDMFWSSFNESDVRFSREHVVTQLILNSFETILDEELQLLFMDVALFSEKFKDYHPYFQSCTSVLEKAYSTLAAMHGKDEAGIRKMVGDLQRLCFIQRATYDVGLVIHDLYREFANSFYENSFKHGAYGVHSCNDKQKQAVINLDEKIVNQDKAGRPLRGLVLYLGLDCKKLFLKNFRDLKALVVTHCSNLVTFTMEGLTSLVTLDVIGFGRKLPIMKCSNVSLQKVRRLNLSCLAVYKKMNDTPEYYERSVYSRESFTEAGCCALGYLMSECIPAAWRPNQGPDMGIAMHMRCLQNLIIRGTGIRKLEDMSSCWPHLEELHVHESLLTEFRLGALPALTTLVFKDCMDHFHHMTSYDYPTEIRVEKLGIFQYNYRKEQKENVDTSILEGEGFLEGCPILQEVRITSAFFRNAHLMNSSSKCLRVIELVCVDAMPQLPDLSSIAGTLQILALISCNDLKHVDFSAVLGFVSLVEVTIGWCDSLVEINLRGLPRLRGLAISDKYSLRVLTGLHDINLVQLQFFRMGYLLYSRQIEGCLSFVKTCMRGFKMQHLSLVYFPVTLSTRFSVFALRDLVTCFPVTLSTRFSVFALRDLVTLNLEYLTQVTHIYGVEGLIYLTRLSLKGCKSLEMLPSLHSLQRVKVLILADCMKLKAVQGCDEMRELTQANFQGCESLEEPPFQDLRLIERSHPQMYYLRLDDCKFLSSSGQCRQLMVEWIHEVESRVLLQALLRQLLWEYYQADRPLHELGLAPTNKHKLVEEMLLPCVLNSLPYDQHNCIDFEKLYSFALYMFKIERWWYVDAKKMVRSLASQRRHFSNN